MGTRWTWAEEVVRTGIMTLSQIEEKMFVSIYLSIYLWPRVAFVASMFPRTRLFNQ